MKFRYQTFNKASVNQYYPLMATYLGVSRPDSATLDYTRVVSGSGPDRPNIVLVICESFSGYKSSMWGNPLNTTPYFNSLCAGGVFFDHCFTPHYGTARGVWATLTGTPDVMIDNTSSRNPQSVDQHSIMNDLQGYQKYYFIGGSASWANIRGVLENNLKGLHLYEQNDYTSPKLDVWGISDKNLFMEADKVLSKQDKPFFAIIQTSDNHRPYTIPAEDRKDFHDVGYPSDTLRKYGFQTNEELNAFRYTDYCFRYFLETARQEPYFRNTIFMFIGDHGIRGDAGNMLPRAWTDEALSCFHVPLLFYAPGLLHPRAAYDELLPGGRHALPGGACSRALYEHHAGQGPVPFGRYQHQCFLYHGPRRKGNRGCDEWVLLCPADQRVVRNAWCPFESNDRFTLGRSTDSLEDHMRTYTDALYQTARYLLINNHKKP